MDYWKRFKSHQKILLIQNQNEKVYSEMKVIKDSKITEFFIHFFMFLGLLFFESLSECIQPAWVPFESTYFISTKFTYISNLHI